MAEPVKSLASGRSTAEPGDLEAGPARRARTIAPGLVFTLLSVAMFAVFSVLSPHVFFTWATVGSIFLTAVVAMLLSVGLVFVLIARDFDLSIANIAAMSGSVAIVAMANAGFPAGAAAALAIVVGIGAGLLNGVVIAYLNADALITTLATGSLFAAVQEWITNDGTVSQGISGGYLAIAERQWFGISAMVICTLALVAVAAFVLRTTVFGRHAYATGANSRVAYQAGIRTRAVRFWSFAIAGGFAAAAGVCLTSMDGSTPEAGSTSTYLLPAYAAVFLGAITVGRGKFTPVAAAVGVLFINTLQIGLVIVGAPQFTTDLATGAVLLAAVLISRATSGTATASLD